MSMRARLKVLAIVPPMAPQVHLNIAQRNIKALVESHGKSVNAWAKAYGFTQTTINRYMTGKLDPPSSMLERIAEAVGLEPWHLLLPDLDPKQPPALSKLSNSEHDTYERISESLEQLRAALEQIKKDTP